MKYDIEEQFPIPETASVYVTQLFKVNKATGECFFMRDTKVPISQLKNLRDWLNKTIEYLSYRAGGRDILKKDKKELIGQLIEFLKEDKNSLINKLTSMETEPGETE